VQFSPLLAGKTMACDLRSHAAKGEIMTPQQVDLVQRTWRAVLPVGDTAAELFYGKLFSLDPSIRSLFKQDLREQGRNLTSMVSVAVGSLSRPQKITLAVQQLGRRHAAYGVAPRHYELVGIALLWMLEQVLGEAFTPEVRQAWAEVYSLLATTMQNACAVH
jgi:hemoglobin-like flavoprotein